MLVVKGDGMYSAKDIAKLIRVAHRFNVKEMTVSDKAVTFRFNNDDAGYVAFNDNKIKHDETLDSGFDDTNSIVNSFAEDQSILDDPVKFLEAEEKKLANEVIDGA